MNVVVFITDVEEEEFYFIETEEENSDIRSQRNIL
jgi:hypothetical protein